MTSLVPTVVRTITADEIRDVTHYCHWIASRQAKSSNMMNLYTAYTAHKLNAALRALSAFKRNSFDQVLLLTQITINETPSEQHKMQEVSP